MMVALYLEVALIHARYNGYTAGDVLSHHTPIFPPASDECKRFDQ
jgi:hypothetical protein